MLKTRFHLCNCFFTKNLYLKKYNLHVTYYDRNQFLQDFSEVLESKGCTDPESLIPELDFEVDRRRNLHDESWNRRTLIARDYKRLNPQIYSLQPSFLHSSFVKLVEVALANDATAEDVTNRMKSHQTQIYSFPVFTHEFCQLLMKELMHFEDSPLPKGRPNTMNHYGIHLGELGFDQFVTTLRKDYIMPITRLLYPEWGGNSLDSHKAFIVKYEEGKDLDLAYHFDNAEVTLNVALNEDYTDGEVYFGPMRTEESSKVVGVAHQMGDGILHRAQQKHGALPISEGVRYNLIIWMRSSEIRNQLCPMCDEKPTLVPIENGFGDGFAVTETNVCVTS